MVITTKNIVITNEISNRIRNDLTFKGFVNKCIGRHFRLDFGDLDEHDKELNLKNAKLGGNVLSIYRYDQDTKIYIMTEESRTITTILLSGEY